LQGRLLVLLAIDIEVATAATGVVRFDEETTTKRARGGMTRGTVAMMIHRLASMHLRCVRRERERAAGGVRIFDGCVPGMRVHPEKPRSIDGV